MGGSLVGSYGYSWEFLGHYVRLKLVGLCYCVLWLEFDGFNFLCLLFVENKLKMG